MAYHSQLDAVAQNKLFDALQTQISRESEAMYQQALSKAKNQKQRKACAGQYKGQWWDLFEAWINDNVSNLHVRDCLNVGYVIQTQ